MNQRTRLPGTPAPELTFENAQGLKLCADAWGPADGPQVLLLHGGGQTRHSWRGTGRMLDAAGYRAVALDARGHGDSDWAPDGDYEQDAFVGDLADVVAALGNRKPVLMGASLGGINALIAVGEGRLKASALVLVDIAPRTEAAGSARVKAFLETNARGFATLDEVADAVAAYRPDAGRPASTKGLEKNLRHGPDGRYYWHWDPRFLDGRDRDIATRYQRLVPAARALTIPALIVRGASSDVVSEDAVQEFLALCPHAEYVNVLDAGHMITGDTNDRFGQVTLEFLARVFS